MRHVFANEATASERRVYFDLRDAADFVTPELDEEGGQPQISSDGAAWTNTGIGTLVPCGGAGQGAACQGRYYAELTQAAVLTAGTVIETRYKSANTVETPGDTVEVKGVDPAAATVPATVAAGAIATDAITAEAVKADAVTKIQAGLSTYAGGAVASVTGDVGGKVLGGGAGVITGTGARVVDASGNNVAPASILSGITSLGNWLRAMLRKDAANATALTEINSGGGAYAETTDSQEAIRDRGDAAWLGSLGSGANPVTITLVDTLAAPVPGLVVVAWNSAITARLGYGTTNASGQVVLNLDAGDIKIAVTTTAAWVAVAATAYTVTSAGAQSVPNITLTAQSVTPPSGASQMTCILDTYDAQGALEASVPVTIELTKGPRTAGQSHDTGQITATSNGSGRVSVALTMGATYRARRGSTGAWVAFLVPTTGTSYTLPEVLGTP